MKEVRRERAPGPGSLYVVATPIGNLEDITLRALRVLSQSDLILAEDTRRTARLLNHYGIGTRLLSLHQHNERRRIEETVSRLEAGANVALVSDAGTPLISDPGFPLLRAIIGRGLGAVPVPGPSAVTAALSIGGLATDRFLFVGFLKARAAARRAQLQALAPLPDTLVLLESPVRIRALLGDLVQCFGGDRQAALARELTKLHEAVSRGTLEGLTRGVSSGEIPERGEFVVLVAGASGSVSAADGSAAVGLEKLLPLLLAELPLKRAVSLAVRITGERRNVVYRTALAMISGPQVASGSKDTSD